MTAQTKFESELRDFVALKKIQNRVHFVNKTLTVAPYLAAIDVLVQNSQVGCHLLLHFVDSNFLNIASFLFLLCKTPSLVNSSHKCS